MTRIPTLTRADRACRDRRLARIRMDIDAGSYAVDPVRTAAAIIALGKRNHGTSDY